MIVECKEKRREKKKEWGKKKGEADGVVCRTTLPADRLA